MKKTLTPGKDAFTVLTVLLMAAGMAVNYRLFIIPNNFAPAGINGIATMIQYRFGFSIAYMSLIVNVPLCIFTYFMTDRRFAVLTLIYCLAYSGIFLLLQSVDMSRFYYNANNIDTIYPCLIAGMISGGIYGICFRLGASTGGTDLISKYISKKVPRLNFFWINFTLNAAVAAASFFVYAKEGPSGTMIYDYKPVCLCLVYSYVSSFIGNHILSGTRMAYQFTIITEHPVEIEREIIEKLHHTATCFHATGAFSSAEKTVLLCVIDRSQIVDLKGILARYEDTFSYVETVNDTIGNFKRSRVFPVDEDKQL